MASKIGFSLQSLVKKKKKVTIISHLFSCFLNMNWHKQVWCIFLFFFSLFLWGEKIETRISLHLTTNWAKLRKTAFFPYFFPFFPLSYFFGMTYREKNQTDIGSCICEIIKVFIWFSKLEFIPISKRLYISKTAKIFFFLICLYDTVLGI